MSRSRPACKRIQVGAQKNTSRYTKEFRPVHERIPTGTRKNSVLFDRAVPAGKKIPDCIAIRDGSEFPLPGHFPACSLYPKWPLPLQLHGLIKAEEVEIYAYLRDVHAVHRGDGLPVALQLRAVTLSVDDGIGLVINNRIQGPSVQPGFLKKEVYAPGIENAVLVSDLCLRGNTLTAVGKALGFNREGYYIFTGAECGIDELTRLSYDKLTSTRGVGKGKTLCEIVYRVHDAGYSFDDEALNRIDKRTAKEGVMEEVLNELKDTEALSPIGAKVEELN